MGGCRIAARERGAGREEGGGRAEGRGKGRRGEGEGGGGGRRGGRGSLVVAMRVDDAAPIACTHRRPNPNWPSPPSPCTQLALPALKARSHLLGPGLT
jgi:hypothetical protein